MTERLMDAVGGAQSLALAADTPDEPPARTTTLADTPADGTGDDA